MNIFYGGRTPFLDFLRNLTPQALILSFSLVLGYKIQQTGAYLENSGLITVLLIFIGVWAAAAWANSTIFIEKYLVSTKKIHRASKLLAKFKVLGFKNFKAVLKFAWRKERLVFIEAFVVFAVLELGLIVVMLTAAASATTFIKVLHS